MLDFVMYSIELNRKYAHGLVGDVAEEQMVAQVAGRAVNHPAWVLGHLAIGNDFACKLMGGPTVCPEGYVKLFDMGTKPLNDRAVYPAKAELLSNFDRTMTNVAAALKQVDESVLRGPMSGPLAQWFPRVGDYVIFDLTAHMGTHLGQLSTWRRALGLPSVLG